MCNNGVYGGHRVPQLRRQFLLQPLLPELRFGRRNQQLEQLEPLHVHLHLQ